VRIHHLSAAAIPSRTANSIQAMRMTAALASLGHEVTLFCCSGEGAPAVDPHVYYGTAPTFEIVRCPWPPVRGVGSLWHAQAVMREAARRGLPDVFYGRHLPSLALAGRAGRPLVAEVHLPPAHVFQRAALRRIFSSPSFDRLLVISESLRAEYLRLFPRLGPARVVIARSAAEAAAPEGNAVRLGGRPAAPRVGYVGHLYPGKGLEIITALAEAMPDVDFHVIGGTEHDLSRWRVRRTSSNLLLHGHVPPGRLAAWMQTFDIALAPYQHHVSVSGGGDAARWMSPLKIVEYMAYGKAIVASDLPPIREVLDHGRTGLLCSPDAPREWCAAIRRLIDEPDLVRRLARDARRESDERHTWIARARLVLA